MRVLVTGHNGYIGTRLVPLLIAAGHDVSGLDTDLFRGCTFTGQVHSIPHLCKDVRDVTKDDVKGFDAIIHLAALSNDPLGDSNPNLTVDITEKASLANVMWTCITYLTFILYLDYTLHDFITINYKKKR